MADVAYVGAGVLGSSVGMDKGVFKDVMRFHQIPSVELIIVLRSEIEQDMNAIIEKAEKVSAYPIFTKPANLGSSVGVTKCRTRSDLQEGLMDAALYDRRVLVERGVANVREIEVSVLGNDDPRASVPGEVLPSREFYSYESKYIDGTSGLLIPAPLPGETTARIQDLAVRAYKAIDAAGMARVDFFLDKDSGEVYLNELNTIPGFTKISMYPKLWEASGMSYAELVDRLIELAMQRKAERDRTSHTYRSRIMSDNHTLSRAEAVRLRRREQSQKRVVKSSQQVTRPLPAITSREKVGTVAAQSTNRSKTRRRYQAAFSMPGIQIHMPAITLPRFEVGWRLLSFFISLLLGAALYLAWTLPMFRITTAQITGNQRISADEINTVLNSAGQPIFTLLPSELEKRIRISYPELASATVTFSLPNVLSVNITERQPVILWQQNGGYTWIDADGIAFRPRGSAR